MMEGGEFDEIDEKGKEGKKSRETRRGGRRTSWRGRGGHHREGEVYLLYREGKSERKKPLWGGEAAKGGGVPQRRRGSRLSKIVRKKEGVLRWSLHITKTKKARDRREGVVKTGKLPKRGREERIQGEEVGVLKEKEGRRARSLLFTGEEK